jgi:PAS domain-containing protein
VEGVEVGHTPGQHKMGINMDYRNNEPEMSGKIEHLQQQVVDLRALLQESEDKFRALTDSAPVGIFLDDAQGKAIFIYKKCAELIGVSPEEALKFNWIAFLHPDDRELMVSKWNKAYHNSEEFHMVYRWVHLGDWDSEAYR